ncbi:MAG: antibiotic biosynthesis monooxygenase [Acidobacteria bacterium]|nr:antibiotic biosynthesis monooxygenase [Acidobacteriota bacterium]
MFVIVAQWYAKEGKEREVAALASQMIPHARSEAGCRYFTVNQHAEDPRRFVLYEQFVDRAAFEAHTQTPAFKELVVGRIVPLLETRVRDVFHAIEPAGAGEPRVH